MIYGRLFLQTVIRRVWR